MIAPKEEVATHAVGNAEGDLAEEKLKVGVINTDGSVAAVRAVALTKHTGQCILMPVSA
ncbi:hypothetical protein [Streptomyces sp. NPDC021212]|uniref:hypothetical protein n=1 Tax=Streptomyces sp. NPDC021212 TaxID=3365118 RepID=UPI0037B928DB